MADVGKSGFVTDKSKMFRFLIRKMHRVMKGSIDRDEKLKTICKLLRDNVPHYNWVGFYILDSRRNDLVLGPFEGEPIEHIRIPVGMGICGQAAERKETSLVQDVSKETNYLSCSKHVKSEIVIPILKGGEVVGELDIDSHYISPFSEEDEIFLKKISGMASKLF